jgi:flagellar biosynthesis component FlhA
MLGLATAALNTFTTPSKKPICTSIRLANFAAQKISSMKDSLKEARREVEAENKEVQKWLKDQVDAAQKVIDGLSHQLGLMESQVRISDKLLANEKERAIKMVHAQVASGQLTKEQGRLLKIR